MEDVKRVLEEAYKVYKLKGGEVTWHGKKEKVDKYSRREMAGRFTEILERLA